ncbi:hypothetical protein [Nitrosovibrio sp. Nv6]|uniref:hypothetical protein n=1 Tax=Nitrosovibrio sp. Nv6 TaxID=1855340 RepID=UPI0008D03392|nr:hypothetical protein [Nitrosovibrio sp. Nv6]SEO65420.1 hypothetical protein SAMN05216316_0719 [Nitrosovibrio sp. Nv6]
MSEITSVDQTSTRFWTTAEERVLSQHYVDGGIEECLAKLPNRSASSIYARAGRLGLRTKIKCSPYKSWEKSEHVDESIRRGYQTTPERGDVESLANQLMRPRWWISKRARELGLTSPRFKEPRWTDAEVELLAKHAHKTLDTIARIFKKQGYVRSPVAIGVRRKRLHLGPRENPDPDFISARQLGVLMGVDAKTITRWIRMEGLPAIPGGTKRTPQQGGDMWRINLKKLHLWIGEHAVQVDLRKVDRFWFIDLMMDGRA